MDERMKLANAIVENARLEILENPNILSLTVPKLLDALRDRNYDREISEVVVIHDTKIYSVEPTKNLFYYFRFSEMTGFITDVLIFYDVCDDNGIFMTTLSAWCQISRALVHREDFATFDREFNGEWGDDYDHIDTETEDIHEKDMSDGLKELIDFNSEAQLKKLRFDDYIKKIFEDESVVKGTIRVRVGRMPDGLIHVVTMDLTNNQRIDMGFDEGGRLREWTSETYNDDGEMFVSKSLFGDENYEED